MATVHELLDRWLRARRDEDGLLASLERLSEQVQRVGAGLVSTRFRLIDLEREIFTHLNLEPDEAAAHRQRWELLEIRNVRDLGHFMALPTRKFEWVTDTDNVFGGDETTFADRKVAAALRDERPDGGIVLDGVSACNDGPLWPKLRNGSVPARLRTVLVREPTRAWTVDALLSAVSELEPARTIRRAALHSALSKLKRLGVVTPVEYGTYTLASAKSDRADGVGGRGRTAWDFEVKRVREAIRRDEHRAAFDLLLARPDGISPAELVRALGLRSTRALGGVANAIRQAAGRAGVNPDRVLQRGGRIVPLVSGIERRVYSPLARPEPEQKEAA